MNASEISEYSHNDIPCQTTDDGEIIEYEAVSRRRGLKPLMTTLKTFIYFNHLFWANIKTGS